MIVGPKQYVPTLKLKRGEKAALGRISVGFRSRTTPLLEIVERNPSKTLNKHLKTAFDGLTQNMKGYSRYFLDAREIEADGPSAAAAAFSWAAGAGVTFTPVTGVSRTADVAAALAALVHTFRFVLRGESHGLALRLTRSEFENGDFPAKIESFLSHHAIAAAGVDLIIDLRCGRGHDQRRRRSPYPGLPKRGAQAR